MTSDSQSNQPLSRDEEGQTELLQDRISLLESPKLWSRALLWVLIGATTFGLLWAIFAQLDQTVQAAGKLEPQGAVKEIKAPFAGVLVSDPPEEGKSVQAQERLLLLDPQVSQSELESLKQIRASLIRENEFYDAATQGKILEAKSEIQALAKLRLTLSTENQYYQAQLQGENLNTSTNLDRSNTQSQLIAQNLKDFGSRITALNLQTQKLEEQRNQINYQLLTVQRILDSNQAILKEFDRVDKEAQKRDSSARAVPVIQYQEKAQQILSQKAEIQRLQSEQERIQVEINQIEEQLKLINTNFSKDALNKIAENEKKIAEIDTQFSRSQLENSKRILEIDTQLQKANSEREYREIKSPVSGKVFNVQPKAKGFVTAPAQTLLTIVPQDADLIAYILIPNKDLGLIQSDSSKSYNARSDEQKFNVRVNIESFSSSDFGSIDGQLIWVGDDALPPSEGRNFYAFPAKVKFQKQSLQKFLKKGVSLQAGMAVNCIIKSPKKRSVMSMFLDFLRNKGDNFSSTLP